MLRGPLPNWPPKRSLGVDSMDLMVVLPVVFKMSEDHTKLFGAIPQVKPWPNKNQPNSWDFERLMILNDLNGLNPIKISYCS